MPTVLGTDSGDRLFLARLYRAVDGGGRAALGMRHDVIWRPRAVEVVGTPHFCRRTGTKCDAPRGPHSMHIFAKGQLENVAMFRLVTALLCVSSIHALHVVVFGTHRPVGRSLAAYAIQNGCTVTRVVPGVELRPVLNGSLDLIAVDGTCVTPAGVELLKRHHGARVCVVHTREEARRAIRYACADEHDEY